MAIKKYHIYVIFCFVFCFYTVGNAQFVQRKLNQSNGLVSYNVRNSLKDEFGFLWICTQDGLSKFNGSSFFNYSKTNRLEKYKIDFADCRGLYLDSINHLIWLLGSSYGFNVLSTTTGVIVKRIPLHFPFPDTWITGFLPLENKLLLTTINGLFEYDPQVCKIKEISIVAGTKQRVNVATIIKNSIWVGVDNKGIFCLSKKDFSIIKSISVKQLKAKSALLKFNTIQFYNGNIIIGTNDNCLSLNYSQLLNNNIAIKQLVNEAITSCVVNNSKIYLGGNFVYELNKDSLLQLKDDDDNWTKETNSLTSLNDNMLAIGTVKGLVFYNLNAPFVQAINTSKSFPFVNHLYSIEASLDDNILLSSINGTFNYCHSLKKYHKINTLSNVVISNIGNNEFIFASPNLLKWYNGLMEVELYKKYPEFEKFKNYYIVKSVLLSNKKFALCTDNSLGILIWDKEKHTIEEINSNHTTFKLKTNIINTCATDESGNLWALSDYSFSVLNFDQKTIKHYSFPQPSNTMIGLYYDMVESNNQYWLSVYGTGVLVLNKKFEIVKTINTQMGLCNNGTYNLFAANNKIYVSTNNGISTIDNKNYTIRNYISISDGLHDDAFEEQVGCVNNKNILFGGLNGFSILNPNYIKVNMEKPSLFFNEIKIVTNDKSIDTFNIIAKNLIVPNNYQQITINFSSINFTHAQQLTYWYKINELHNSWIALENQNYITLIGIAPGKYTLQIKCANEDGIKSDVKQLQLVFLPKWYQTLLFKITILLAIASLLYALYKYRINQLTKLLIMRQKISQDLHDDVGSSLSSIKMYSQVIQMQNANNPLMQNIEENTTDVLQKLDDIVWATNPRNDNLQNTIDRLELFIKPLCKTAGINLIMQMPANNNAVFINELSRHCLYMIVKEAINNALKYAQCSTITFTLLLTNKTIVATISDDGIGFDATMPTTRNGLLNMQIRSTHAKGKLTLHSTLNQGTTISITLPKK